MQKTIATADDYLGLAMPLLVSVIASNFILNADKIFIRAGIGETLAFSVVQWPLALTFIFVGFGLLITRYKAIKKERIFGAPGRNNPIRLPLALAAILAGLMVVIVAGLLAIPLDVLARLTGSKGDFYAALNSIGNRLADNTKRTLNWARNPDETARESEVTPTTKKTKHETKEAAITLLVPIGAVATACFSVRGVLMPLGDPDALSNFVFTILSLGVTAAGIAYLYNKRKREVSN